MTFKEFLNALGFYFSIVALFPTFPNAEPYAFLLYYAPCHMLAALSGSLLLDLEDIDRVLFNLLSIYVFIFCVDCSSKRPLNLPYCKLQTKICRCYDSVI